MAKVAWTLGHALATCLTLEVAINSAEAGIHETSGLDLASALLQHFGKLDLAYRVRFLRGKPHGQHPLTTSENTTENTYDFFG
jgi:hypothetical protein